MQVLIVVLILDSVQALVRSPALTTSLCLICVSYIKKTTQGNNGAALIYQRIMCSCFEPLNGIVVYSEFPMGIALSLIPVRERGKGGVERGREGGIERERPWPSNLRLWNASHQYFDFSFGNSCVSFFKDIFSLFIGSLRRNPSRPSDTSFLL